MSKSVTKIIPTINFDQNTSIYSPYIDPPSIENSSTNTDSSTTKPTTNKVYYIADASNGAIASYNPNYILRQLPGQDPYKIYLPAEPGTLILTEEVDSLYNNIYKDIHQITDDITDINDDYNKLKNKVNNISKKVKGYVSKTDLKEALEEAVASDLPETGYTIEEIVKSYNKLLQSLRSLIKE